MTSPFDRSGDETHASGCCLRHGRTGHDIRRRIVVVVGLAIIGLARLAICDASDGPSPQSTSSPTPIAADDDEMKELQAVQDGIVEGINAYRQKHSLESLQRDPQLHQAAIDFARFMARTDKYGHQADDRTPSERASAAGYRACVIRENIAYRQDPTEVTPTELIDFFVDGWIDSPPHRENIRAEFVTQTGVGVATNDGVRFYGVQLFGRPKSRSFDVRVTNDRDAEVILTVESEAGNDSVTLPPRSYANFRRCFPTTIGIEGEADMSRKLHESVELSITEDGWQEP